MIEDAPTLPTLPTLPTKVPTSTPMIEDPPLPLAPTPTSMIENLPLRTAPGTPSDEPVTPIIEPTPSASVVTGLAPIESVAVQIVESLPVVVYVVVNRYLEDSCTELSETEQVRNGDQFSIRMVTARPANKACATVIERFEQVIPLEAADFEAGTYIVRLNDVSETFEVSTGSDSP